MKKYLILLIGFLGSLLNLKIVLATGDCEINAAKQMSKILYTEVGGSYTSDASENFFGRLATASVILNHTTFSNHNTGSLYNRMLNYTNSEYQNYSSYKNKTFEAVVPESRRGEMLYISALVLSGKFTFPKEIIYQAAESILKNDGAHEFTHSGNVYFGYGKNVTLSGQDVFGNRVSTSAEGYRNLAKRLEKSSYDTYNSNDVCRLVDRESDGGFGSDSDSDSGSFGGGSLNGDNFDSDDSNLFNHDDGPRLDYDNICNNGNIQKAFRIIGVFISIIKVLVPLLLIVFGMLDFGKAVIANDENNIKKATNSLIKRFIAGIIVFFIPTLILVFMDWIEITRGIDSVDDENFGGCTRCLFDPNDDSCK